MQLWVVGCVDLWSTETGGEPIQHYQSPGAIQVMALSPDSPVLGSVTGPNIRLDHANDQGYWRTLHQAQLPKDVCCTSWFLMLQSDVFELKTCWYGRSRAWFWCLAGARSIHLQP